MLYVGVWAQAAPPVTALLARRPLKGARLWVVVWCLFLLSVDLLARWLGAHQQRNLWLLFAYTPVSGVLVLWALSCWQVREVPRLALRLAIAPFLVAWGLLVLFVDNTSDFSRAAQPMAELMCLAAATYTLLERGFRATVSPTRQDWFWVCAGLALNSAVSAAVFPLSAALVGSDPAALVVAYEVRAGFLALAFTLIAVGIACPAET